MKTIAIFASGTGTNAVNLLEEQRRFPQVQVGCVVVDTLTSKLPELLAQRFPQLAVYRIIPDRTLSGAQKKAEHEGRILEKLRAHAVEWILLAGYMRIVGPVLLEAFPDRIINIHPSLLPQYPGLHGYERAFSDKVSSGVTIHFVDGGLDTGPVILQKSFPRFDTDSLSDFIERGKRVEWELYPEILRRISHNLLAGE